MISRKKLLLIPVTIEKQQTNTMLQFAIYLSIYLSIYPLFYVYFYQTSTQ